MEVLNFTSFLETMKNFWANMSITKLVFLEVMTVLCFLVIRVITIQNVENELAKTILKMFEFAVTSIISFYFGQKVGEAKRDPLIDNSNQDGGTTDISN